MENFAAIDFETANSQRSSICSVGLVVVRNGKVADQFYSLVYPEPDYFSFYNTAVHGLTSQDVKDAPLFPDVWRLIEPKIQGLPLVAHNAAFDKSCLKSAFSIYMMDYPDYEFLCTFRESKSLLGNLLPNYQLQTVAAYCGYDLSQHHHALADAYACAAIAIKLL